MVFVFELIKRGSISRHTYPYALQLSAKRVFIISRYNTRKIYPPPLLEPPPPEEDLEEPPPEFILPPEEDLEEPELKLPLPDDDLPELLLKLSLDLLLP